MSEEDPTRTWWVLFPVSGITLTDRQPDLARPLFGDATLLAVTHIPILERQVQRLHGRSLSFMDFLQVTTAFRDFTTYLAVCRRAPATVTEDDEAYDQLITATKERADQVVAALSIALFAQRADGRTISLLERQYMRTQFLTILDLDLGGSGHSFSGAHAARVLSSRDMVALSRRELRSWRRDPRFRALWDAVLTPSRVLPRSLRNAITQSCVRLADAFTSPILPAQLLASVTALEVLLTYTNQGTGFAGVEHRVAALLGTSLSDRLQLKAVLQARHRYVHQGERIHNDELVLSALVLTIATILVYAQGMMAFHDKNALLAYLDIVSIARGLQTDHQTRPLVQIRAVFPTLPDDIPMLALLAKVHDKHVRFYRE